MRINHAITFGRYSLLTKAHLSTVKAILDIWDHLTIGVLDFEISRPKNEFNEKWRHFFELCDENCRPENNAFSSEERLSMWTETIKEEKLTDRVDVVSLKRPEYDQVSFNTNYSKDKFNLVFPRSKLEKESFDLIRNSIFSEILNREIFFVEPKLTLHSSDIKIKILNGEKLEKYIPAGALKVFNEISGSDRLFPELGKVL